MTELLGSIGWGLLACASITHIWHQRRLQTLLASHFDRERIPALALTMVELVLSVALPIAVLTDHRALPILALAAAVLAAGFMAWIARLLVTGSELPCACSFSAAPTSIWSLGRSVCVGFVAFFLLTTAGDVADTGVGEHLAILAVGWAVAAAIFVIPEAVTWPTPSKALMVRVNAHGSGS